MKQTLVATVNNATNDRNKKFDDDLGERKRHNEELERHNQVMEDVAKSQLLLSQKKMEVDTQSAQLQLRKELFAIYQDCKQRQMDDASILAVFPQLQPIVEALSGKTPASPQP